jgi:hypothetical protein
MPLGSWRTRERENCHQLQLWIEVRLDNLEGKVGVRSLERAQREPFLQCLNGVRLLRLKMPACSSSDSQAQIHKRSFSIG